MARNNPSKKQIEMFEKFWHLLSHLELYVSTINKMVPEGGNPARTLILSSLVEKMLPALSADIAFLGYRDGVERSENDFLIIKESLRFAKVPDWQNPFVRQLENIKWKFPYAELETLNGQVITLFDSSLSETPHPFQGLITALALCRLELSGREYVLFFVDVVEKQISPRFNTYDKTMLSVVTGIFKVGFSSGVRKGVSTKWLQRYIVATIITLVILGSAFAMPVWVSKMVSPELLPFTLLVSLFVALIALVFILGNMFSGGPKEALSVLKELVKKIPNLPK